jgi:MOSC domain-containing protein YiiM
MTGKVIELFITKNDDTKTRLSVTSIQVDEHGIIGDKFYAKDSMRSILLSSQDSYKMSKENGINLNSGALGENILIDINPYGLVHGDKIKIGNSLLEITQNCTLCKGLSTLNSKLPKLLKNDRGIFAKLLKGSSEIHINDKVEIQCY